MLLMNSIFFIYHICPVSVIKMCRSHLINAGVSSSTFRKKYILQTRGLQFSFLLSAKCNVTSINLEDNMPMH